MTTRSAAEPSAKPRNLLQRLADAIVTRLQIGESGRRTGVIQ